MKQKQYTYRARVTPGGQHVVEFLYQGVVVGTGKHAHPSAEAALKEVRDALDNLSLAPLIVPNGKLLELIP